MTKNGNILHRISFIYYPETRFEYLGPAVIHLSYKENESDAGRSGQSHILSPMEELFLVLVHLQLGLMEQDIAYRFNISQSTVSGLGIIITWINFMYLQFKYLHLWPKKRSSGFLHTSSV